YVPHLVREFASLAEEARRRFGVGMEFVFVVDASPDRSYELLAEALPRAAFASQLLLHVRNFGSFAAIRSGMQAARGDYLAVIAADLQEPPSLLLEFLEVLLGGEYEVAIGVREGRDDPASSKFASNLFWDLYRLLVMPQIPKGGVDVFGCSRRVRDELLAMREANSSLVGLVFWLGFKRAELPYVRRAREFGRSAWTLKKKINYLLDNIFAFSDLPVRILSVLGFLGVMVAAALGLSVLILRVAGWIDIPGYAATIITVIFFGALNTLGLGIIGAYAWRTYENTKQRPLALVQSQRLFGGVVARPLEAAPVGDLAR
ncbi:MAG: glycosyltransferase, partial [Acetobacteraceae bacterium]|nr:glycosyltransferase [Acetobacteraceae bacterium]